MITLDQLARDFTGLFSEQAFRLEALDYYYAPNEREPYARFRAGQPVDPAWREPWKRLVTSVRESGRTMSRVHVVTEPVTPYVRFSLLHGYPASVAAGEDVRILGRAAAEAAGLPGRDFWLFDNELAAVLTYDSEGRAGLVELETRPATLAELRAARDKALQLAVPLARYVAAQKIRTERTRAA